MLTVRSHNLTHPGEVALCGGRCDPGDISLIDTAFREAEEEIGIKRADLKVLTILPVLSRLSNYIVTPVIAKHIGDLALKFASSPDEVSEIFTVPLRKFLFLKFCYSFYILQEDSYPLHVVRHSRYKRLWA